MDRPPWTFYALGRIALQRGEQVIQRFRQQRTALLLALLARAPGRTWTRDALLERLWPEVDPTVGRRRLSVLLAELRAILEEGRARGSVLAGDNERLWLISGEIRTDVSEFEHALILADRAPTPEARAEALQEALQRYGGPYLPGLDDDEVEHARQELAQRHHGAALALVSALEAAGRPAEALSTLLRVESHEAPGEETQARLMRLFLATGRAEAGLDHFRTWERQHLRATGRRPPAHLQRLAAALEGAVSRAAPAPTPADTPAMEALPTLRTWVAARTTTLGPSALEAPLLVRGVRQGPATAWFAEVRHALDAARALAELPGVAVALETGPAEAGLRAQALLRATPEGGVLIGEAAAALLRQIQPQPTDLRALGCFLLAQAGPVTLWGLPGAGGRALAPLLPRIGAPLPEEAPLFGRAEALDALRAASTPGSLVTLTGIGGIGKTTLAMALLRDPIWRGARVFVDLSAVTDRPGALAALATALGVEQLRGDPLAEIRRRLTGPSRVILDNAEQIQEPLAHLLEPLRRELPQVAWCVTSRLPLGLSGEQVLGLEGLALPHGALSPTSLREVPAVALFLARARQQDPQFGLNTANMRTISALVTALEGIPLAIELAASRIRGWTPDALLARLGAQPLDVLAWRARPGPARQSTLRAALEWSWELLSPWERAALAQMSVFRGGFTLDAAEAVLDLSGARGAPFPMDVVDALVSHSLVRALPPGEDLPPRYGLFTAVTEYAAEKLESPEPAPPGMGPAHAAAARLRHAAWYARLGGLDRLDALEGPEGPAALRRLRIERDNLLAAAGAALQAGQAPPALAAARALVELTILAGGGADLGPLVRALLELPGLEGAARLDLQAAYAFARYTSAEDAEAIPLAVEAARQALAQPSPTRHDARTLRRAALVQAFSGALDPAEQLAQAALQAARSPVERAGALAALSLIAAWRGDPRRAVALNRQVLEAAGPALPLWTTDAAVALLFDLTELRDFDGARAQVAELQIRPEAASGARYEVWILTARVMLAIQTGELDLAEALCRAATDILRSSGLRSSDEDLDDWLAEVEARRGRWDRALALRARYLGRALSPRDAWNARSTPLMLARVGRVEEAVAFARQGLELLQSSGFRTTADAHLFLGHARRAQGDADGAAQAWRDAMATPSGDAPAPAQALAAGLLSELAINAGDLAQAEALVRVPAATFPPGERGEEIGLALAWTAAVALARGDRTEARARRADAEEILGALGAEPGSELGRVLGWIDSISR